MPPDSPVPDKFPSAPGSREARSERLRHWRHLLADEHFKAFLAYARTKVQTPALDLALDESANKKTRRRALARYHAAREILELVESEEKTLAATLEKPR